MTAALPLFLVGAARSGTTLMRSLLGRHEAIVAPSEGDVGRLVVQLLHTWQVATEEAPALESYAHRAIREAALTPMARLCRETGSRVYCDKTLGSVDYIQGIALVIPEARYVFLYRHAMDVVASALDACPWGFRGYGLELPMARSADNFVAGLLRYWNGQVAAALAAEARLGGRAVRIRYEDLVMDPSRTLAPVWTLLGLPNHTETRGGHELSGALGDHEIAYVDGISTDSVESGRQVPVPMIPPALLAATNEHLLRLGFGEVGSDWNATCRDLPETIISGHRRLALRDLNDALEAAGECGEPDKGFEIVADDCTDQRWSLVRNSDPGGGRAFRLVGSAEDLLRCVDGRISVGDAIRRGYLRYVGSQPAGREATDVRPALRWLAAGRRAHAAGE